MNEESFKKLKRFHEPGDYHELTFGCYLGIPLLRNKRTCQRLSLAIDRAAEKWDFRISAFVYMPNHVHLLVYPVGKAPLIDKFLASVKQPVSAFVRERMDQAKSPMLERLLVRERPGRWCFRFWQEGGGYDRNLRNYKAVDASIQYIHANPVRRELVDRPTDWKWSSARYFRDPRLIDPDLPTIYGLNRENPEIVIESNRRFGGRNSR